MILSFKRLREQVWNLKNVIIFMSIKLRERGWFFRSENLDVLFTSRVPSVTSRRYKNIGPEKKYIKLHFKDSVFNVIAQKLTFQLKSPICSDSFIFWLCQFLALPFATLKMKSLKADKFKIFCPPCYFNHESNQLLRESKVKILKIFVTSQ